jgi:hypothetical protein
MWRYSALHDNILQRDKDKYLYFGFHHQMCLNFEYSIVIVYLVEIRKMYTFYIRIVLIAISESKGSNYPFGFLELFFAV